jgi:hypothetical protein
MASSSASSWTPKAFDVVGVRKSENGRSCHHQHDVCGEHLKVNDVLVLQKCIVTIDNKHEAAIAAVKVVNGQLGCRVGFISSSFLALARCFIILYENG